MGLEHYTRVRRLGKGSFGEVHLVTDKRNGTQYVMKEVDLQQFGPKGRKEALKEVGFLNAMHHPYIVGYREFFEQDPSGVRRKDTYRWSMRGVSSIARS
jgi:NIMA (never in mitosis gene a)-related kinase